MSDLVISNTNEELAFLSYVKSGTIRRGTGIISGFYNSGPTAKYNIPYVDTNDGTAVLRHSEVNMALQNGLALLHWHQHLILNYIFFLIIYLT